MRQYKHRAWQILENCSDVLIIYGGISNCSGKFETVPFGAEPAREQMPLGVDRKRHQHYY